MKKIIAALLSMSLCLSGTGMICSAEEVKVNEVVSEKQIEELEAKLDELEKQNDNLNNKNAETESLENKLNEELNKPSEQEKILETDEKSNKQADVKETKISNSNNSEKFKKLRKLIVRIIIFIAKMIFVVGVYKIGEIVGILKSDYYNEVYEVKCNCPSPNAIKEAKKILKELVKYAHPDSMPKDCDNDKCKIIKIYLFAQKMRETLKFRKHSI